MFQLFVSIRTMFVGHLGTILFFKQTFARLNIIDKSVTSENVKERKKKKNQVVKLKLTSSC